MRHFHFHDAGWPSAQLTCATCSWQGCADEAQIEDGPTRRIAKCPRCPQPPILAIIVYPTLAESIEAGEKLFGRDRRH